MADRRMTVVGAERIANPPAWERRVRAAVRKAAGDSYAAAESLGVSIRTYYRYLAEVRKKDERGA
jgi:transposase